MSLPTSDPEIRSVRISSTHNAINVIGETRGDVVVDGDARATVDGDQMTIDHVKGKLVVRVPESVDLVVGTASGRITLKGRLGEVAVVSTSGRVTVDDATSIDARTTNAGVEVRNVAGDCRIRTTSGRVVVHGCGLADVATDSGRIVLHGVRGSVRAHCVSGRVEIHLDEANDVEAETVSGRVSVSLPPGVRAHQPQGARAGVQPHDCDCTVCAKSVSGRVTVSSR